MNIPIQKLKAIILYFCENTDSKFLGKVKLMKLFYFLDFIHVKRFGAPVTFDLYVKLEHGPIPSTIKGMVDDAGEDVDHSALADTIDIERPDGTSMLKVVPRRKFSEDDRKLLSDNEMNVLAQVCARFGDKNTAYIEEASHREAGWQRTPMYKEIPYTLAAEDADSLVTADEIAFTLELSKPF